MRVFFDSCIWIYAVENHPVFGPSVKRALYDSQDNLELRTTELVRFECMVGVLKNRNKQSEQLYTEAFKDLVYVDLSRKVFDIAAEIRAKYSLKSLDAIHLASAITGGCDEFWTNDSRLQKVTDLIYSRVIT